MNTKIEPVEMSVEESFQRLEEILADMENEATGLEESFRLYEEGVRLLKNTRDSIDRVEQKIKVLSGTETAQQL